MISRSNYYKCLLRQMECNLIAQLYKKKYFFLVNTFMLNFKNMYMKLKNYEPLQKDNGYPLVSFRSV